MPLAQPLRADVARHPAPRATANIRVAGREVVCCNPYVLRGKRLSALPAAHPAQAPHSDAAPAIEALFTAHSAYVARLAYRLLGRDDDVDDVVQDAFVLLYKHLGNLRDAGAIRSWLATTTIRLVRRRLMLRRIGFLLRAGQRTDPEDLHATAVSSDDRMALRNIHTALRRVSAGERVAWVMRYIEQESIDDVARLCGCSPATAKRRIAAAQAVVKRALAE